MRDQTIPKLHERPPLHRHIHLAQVLQHKVHQRLILLLAQPPHKALTRELFPESIRCQSILGEAKVKKARHVEPFALGALRHELLLLFLEVRAADEADGAFVAERGKGGEHGGGDGAAGGGEGAVDVEKAEGLGEGAGGEGGEDCGGLGGHDWR